MRETSARRAAGRRTRPDRAPGGRQRRGRRKGTAGREDRRTPGGRRRSGERRVYRRVRDPEPGTGRLSLSAASRRPRCGRGLSAFSTRSRLYCRPAGFLPTRVLSLGLVPGVLLRRASRSHPARGPGGRRRPRSARRSLAGSGRRSLSWNSLSTRAAPVVRPLPTRAARSLRALSPPPRRSAPASPSAAPSCRRAFLRPAAPGLRPRRLPSPSAA